MTVLKSQMRLHETETASSLRKPIIPDFILSQAFSYAPKDDPEFQDSSWQNP
jgi:hypothetical protein